MSSIDTFLNRLKESFSLSSSLNLSGQELVKASITRFMMAVGVLALIAIINYCLVAQQLDLIGESSTAVINSSGRQRALVNLAVGLSNALVEAETDVEKEDQRTELMVTLEELRATHKLLKEEDSPLRLQEDLSPELQNIYYQPPYMLDSRMTGFTDQVQELVNSPNDALTHDNISLSMVNRLFIRGDLMNALDAIANQFQTENEKKREHLKNLNNINLLVILILLGLMSVLVFNPLVKGLRSYIGQVENAEDKLKHELKKQIATLTHDLKTPLRAERKALELLEKHQFGELSGDQQAVIHEILQSNQYMYRMVDNLLTFYRLDQVAISLNPVPLNINQLIRNIGDELMYLVNDKQQTLSLHLDESIPEILMDQHEMQRVFYNLIQNANHYTPEQGLITVTSTLLKEGIKDGKEGADISPEPQLYITVRDNGPGIEPEFLPVLFQPYHTRSKKYRQVGTGLGLYLSKHIVEAHQGRLTVESWPGEGTEFRIHLPAKVSPAHIVSTANLPSA
ncbi:MAG: HAMP domain-containing histidine kinase [Vampirovibrio sp.]|nr:HAMP domain-containing histidine kinase [Vampirovibrio sp.]